MGAASANVPALQLSGGYRRPGRFRGQKVGAGTDLWRYWDQRRAGRLDDDDWTCLQAALGCSQGACNVMGTALTIAAHVSRRAPAPWPLDAGRREDRFQCVVEGKVEGPRATVHFGHEHATFVRAQQHLRQVLGLAVGADFSALP